MLPNPAYQLPADVATFHQAADLTVYVIDDNSELRKSLHFFLATSNIAVWPFAASEDFFAHLPTLTPGPVLLDMRMSGMDGIETLTKLRERDVTWPVIIMTAHGDIPLAVQAMKLGAIDFLEKPFRTEMLDEVLARAFTILNSTRDTVLCAEEARASLQKLSLRESEVVKLLVQGMPNKLVAHRLGLSTRTVEMHRRNAFQKLRLKSVAEILNLMSNASSSAFAIQGVNARGQRQPPDAVTGRSQPPVAPTMGAAA